MNYLTHTTLETKPWKFVATACVVAEIFQVACTIMWPWISRSSVKVTQIGIGGIPWPIKHWKQKMIFKIACLEADIHLMMILDMHLTRAYF